MGIAGPNQSSEQIIGAFYDVYNELGSYFAEAVYRKAVIVALVARGRRVQCEVPIRVFFHGVDVGLYKADLIVDEAYVLELKTARAIDSAHEAQLLNLLRATPVEVGFIFNFGPQPAFKRMVLSNEHKMRVVPA
jgi:GxxExxY protein